MLHDIDKKKVLSWALYDWANSAFATTVMAGFFPIFFREYWSAGSDPADITGRLGFANSAASIVVAALAPVLGAIADRGGAKRRFLLFFATLGIVMTGSMFFVARGQWGVAIVLYALATMGFSGGNIFYDSLIVGVAPTRRIDLVSAMGFALGYLGGGLLFAANVAMTLSPSTFGLVDAAQAVRLSFILVAIWWAVFTIPLLLFVPEPRIGTSSGWAAALAGVRQLRETFSHLRRLRVVALFLAAYWLYIDGLDTIVRMAVDYGLSLGFDKNDLILALLITQFVGFPAALAFGRLGERIGTKNGILLGIAAYILITVGGAFVTRPAHFYMLAIAIGLVQGGVQSLSRALYVRIIPPDKAAEFFGFYNMLGKFAAVIGPLLMGGVSVLTHSPRLSILSVVVLFIAGGALLMRVDVDEGHRAAQKL